MPTNNASMANTTSTATTPSSKRKRGDVLGNDDDDDIILNLGATGSPVETPRQGYNYSSPVASTSFIGRALSAVASTVFKRRKISSPTVQEPLTIHASTIKNEDVIVDQQEKRQLSATSQMPQPQISLSSPQSPTRKALKLDLAHSTKVTTNAPFSGTLNNITHNSFNDRLLMSSYNGPAPSLSAVPPFQSPMLKQPQQQHEATNTTLHPKPQKAATATIKKPSRRDPFSPSAFENVVLYNAGRGNRTGQKSLEFVNGRLMPKSHLFLQASSNSVKMKEKIRQQNRQDASAISKKILAALEEHGSYSLIPPPPPSTTETSYRKHSVTLLGGRDIYMSRLPGQHPFAPPPKERLPLTHITKATPQILSRTPTTTTEQQQQKLAGISPMKSTLAMAQIHDKATPAIATTVTTTYSRELPSRSQILQHIRNLRQSRGYLESYQKIMKNAGDDSYVIAALSSTSHHEPGYTEKVNEVIHEIVQGQQDDYDTGITFADGILNSLMSGMRKRASRKPLNPKTTQGHAWWNDDKSSNKTKEQERNMSQQQPASSILPYPLLGGYDNKLTSNALLVVPSQAIRTAKKMRAMDATGPSLDGAKDSTSSQLLIGEAPKPQQQQVNDTADTTSTSNMSFWNAHLLKPGQWKCSVCMAKNEPTSSKCVSCETPKQPTDNGTKGDSTSSQSHVGEVPKQQQQANHTVDTTSTSNISFWNAHLLKPGEWKCSVCMAKNESTNLKCVSCESPKQQDDNKNDTKQPTDSGIKGAVTPFASSVNGDISKNKSGFSFVSSSSTPFNSNDTTTTGAASFSFGSSNSINATASNLFQGGATSTIDAPSAFKFGSSTIFATDKTKSISDAATSKAASDNSNKGFIFGSVGNTTESHTSTNNVAQKVQPDSAPASKESASADSSNLFRSSLGMGSTAASAPTAVSSSGGDGGAGGAISFGPSSSVPAPLPSGAAFSFGKSSKPADSLGTAPAPAPAFGGFTFGAASSTKPAEGAGFKFGTDTSAAPTSESATTKPSTTTFGAGSGTVSSNAIAPSSFTFGGTSMPASTATVAPPAVTQEPTVFAFGTPSAAASTPALPTSNLGGFSFGLPSAPPVNAPTVASSGFSIGGSAPGQAGGVAATTLSNPFGATGFSSTSQMDASAPASAAAPSSMFTFGSNTGMTPGFVGTAVQPSFGMMQPPTSGLPQQVGALGSVPAGGGFSLGTGGSTGAKRRIVKAKRPSNSR